MIPAAITCEREGGPGRGGAAQGGVPGMRSRCRREGPRGQRARPQRARQSRVEAPPRRARAAERRRGRGRGAPGLSKPGSKSRPTSRAMTTHRARNDKNTMPGAIRELPRGRPGPAARRTVPASRLSRAPLQGVTRPRKPAIRREPGPIGARQRPTGCRGRAVRRPPGVGTEWAAAARGPGPVRTRPRAENPRSASRRPRIPAALPGLRVRARQTSPQRPREGTATSRDLPGENPGHVRAWPPGGPARPGPGRTWPSRPAYLGPNCTRPREMDTRAICGLAGGGRARGRFAGRMRLADTLGLAPPSAPRDAPASPRPSRGVDSRRVRRQVASARPRERPDRCFCFAERVACRGSVDGPAMSVSWSVMSLSAFATRFRRSALAAIPACVHGVPLAACRPPMLPTWSPYAGRASAPGALVEYSCPCSRPRSLTCQASTSPTASAFDTLASVKARGSCATRSRGLGVMKGRHGNPARSGGRRLPTRSWGTACRRAWTC